MLNQKKVKNRSSRQETYLYRPVCPEPDAVKIGLVSPLNYAMSMSSLGYLALFRLMDERSDVAARRITMDDIRSQPVNDLDMLGFSISFELNILEIIKILNSYGIPLYSSERGREYPLLFAGGPVVMANPEPYADLFDFFLIGEGEAVLSNLVTEFKQYRRFNSSRKDLLYYLAMNVKGLYAPSLYHVDYESRGEIKAIFPPIEGLPFPVQKEIVSNLDETVTYSPILTEEAVFSNMFLLEVVRGCIQKCRFCLASYSMLPERAPSLEKIIETIEIGLQYSNKIGLLGALVADHPEFEALCHFLKSKEGIQVSSASLRADRLTPHIAETFKKCGQQSLTIAVETGSEKLRQRINKHLKTESILNAASIISKSGIKGLKIYGMIGLPDEEWSDLEETVALLRLIKEYNPSLRLNFGLSTFVPKGATPFQWVSRQNTKELKEKERFLQKSLVKISDFSSSSPKWDYIQALLARGDRRLATFLVEFSRQGGNPGALRRTLKELESMSVDFPALDWYALRERPYSEILPWDVISLGVSKEILYRESGLKRENPEKMTIGG